MITEIKKQEITELLDKVNVKAICRKQRVRYATVYEVLKGTSKKYALLQKVVKAARKEVEKIEKQLSTL